jgi:hypothetical protein
LILKQKNKKYFIFSKQINQTKEKIETSLAYLNYLQIPMYFHLQIKVMCDDISIILKIKIKIKIIKK